jgi:hypothetical protein
LISKLEAVRAIGLPVGVFADIPRWSWRPGGRAAVESPSHAELAEVGLQDCSSADEFGRPARSSFPYVRAWRTG